MDSFRSAAVSERSQSTPEPVFDMALATAAGESDGLFVDCVQLLRMALRPERRVRPGRRVWSEPQAAARPGMRVLCRSAQNEGVA